MSLRDHEPTIDTDGWVLLSGEEHQRQHPTFFLPALEDRQALRVGQAAKLLFDIERREDGRTIDRGVDRMWVIVKHAGPRQYIGVLDSDPGTADNLKLRPGDEVRFGAEHVIAIGNPPKTYVVEKYGQGFFEE